MKKILLIGVAGAVGAILRVTVGTLFSSSSSFPLSTLTVNLVGTFLLCLFAAGLLTKLNMKRELQDIVMTGFLGSFTTFSALSMETVGMIEKGQYTAALIYCGLSILGGLVVGSLGFYLGGKKGLK
jgi:CrcB protein